MHSDTLILACTHYPLIIKDIKKVLKQNKNNIKNIVYASHKTALSVKEYLKKNNLLNEGKRNKFIIYSTLNDKNKAQNLLNIFLNNKEYKLELINLD